MYFFSNQLLFSLTFVLAFAGCSATSPLCNKYTNDYCEKKVDRFDDAVAVNIAMGMPVLLSELGEDIYPVYDITAAESLKLALPTTAQRKSLRSQQYGLSISAVTPDIGKFISSDESSSDESFSENNSSEDNSSEDNSSEDSSNENSLESDSKSSSGMTLESMMAGLKDANQSGFTLGIDPIRQVHNAASIYQEVKLQNKYYRLSSQYSDYVPYMTRIAVGVMPKVKFLPYDVYATLDFSLDIKNPQITESGFLFDELRGLANWARNYNEFKDTYERGWKKKESAELNLSIYEMLKESDLLIFPMQTVENGELIDNFDALQKAVDFLVEGNILTGGANVTAGANSSLESYLSDYAKINNNLFSVSKVNSDKIAVRIGAAHYPNAQEPMYETQSSTHYVNVLILVPKKIAQENVAVKNAKIIMSQSVKVVHWREGKEFSYKTDANLKYETTKMFEKAFKNKKIPNELIEKFIDRFYSAMNEDDNLWIRNQHDFCALIGDDSNCLSKTYELCVDDIRKKNEKSNNCNNIRNVISKSREYYLKNTAKKSEATLPQIKDYGVYENILTGEAYIDSKKSKLIATVYGFENASNDWSVYSSKIDCTKKEQSCKFKKEEDLTEKSFIIKSISQKVKDKFNVQFTFRLTQNQIKYFQDGDKLSLTLFKLEDVFKKIKNGDVEVTIFKPKKPDSETKRPKSIFKLINPNIVLRASCEYEGKMLIQLDKQGLKDKFNSDLHKVSIEGATLSSADGNAKKDGNGIKFTEYGASNVELINLDSRNNVKVMLYERTAATKKGLKKGPFKLNGFYTVPVIDKVGCSKNKNTDTH